MRLGDAQSHCPLGPLDLGFFAHSLLLEHRQQDDAPTRRDPVADPHRLPLKVEAQLPELAVELPRVRLIQQDAMLS
jgi:hypothetical protein